MRPGTRDNFICLSVGLIVAALVTFDFFYADSHGLEMWWPTNFEFSLVANLILVEYFVVTETRKIGATTKQILAFVLVAVVLHVTALYLFRGPFYGRAYTALPAWVLEIFVITQLAIWAARRLRSDH